MTTPEKMNSTVVMSVVLHVGVFGVLVLSPSLFPFHSGESWGTKSSGEGIAVKLVGSSGIALPAPEKTVENAIANESKGLHTTEAPPKTPPPPPKDVVKIPENKVLKATRTPPRPAPPAPAPQPKQNMPQPEQTTAANAVPYGAGGRPDIGYGQSTQNGPVGATAVGEGAFGEKYASYVQAIVRKISQNWLQGLIDSRVTRAPRVYVQFDVMRDGSINNVQIQQSSGVPTLDNSARRAVFAATPLLPLPREYTGTKVTVSFYFEYVKQ